MEQTEQRPTVLVIDTMERLREFNSKANKLTASMLARLKAKAVPVGSEESQSVEVCDSTLAPPSMNNHFGVAA